MAGEDEVKLRDKNCKCGWKFPGFHVCVDLSRPDPKILGVNHFPKGTKERPNMTASTRLALSEAAQRRAAREREANAPRDARIVERYNEGDISVAETARMFEISRNNAAEILRRAGCEIRKPGGASVMPNRRRAS